MRKNSFEFRSTVLNQLFSQRMRRFRQSETKYVDEEKANTSRLPKVMFCFKNRITEWRQT